MSILIYPPIVPISKESHVLGSMLGAAHKKHLPELHLKDCWAQSLYEALNQVIYLY